MSTGTQTPISAFGREQPLAAQIQRANAMAKRRLFMQGVSAYGGERDYYETLGYPNNPEPSDYLRMYLREDIARRIVDAPPATCWRSFPTVLEDEDDESQTEFEQAVATLEDEKRLSHYLERADKLAGIGSYGVLVIGYADGDDSDMEQPVNQSNLTGKVDEDIAYFAPFSEVDIVDISIEDDPRKERYGLPNAYQIEYSEDDSGTWTHWERVIHVAEDLLSDEVHGRPRLEPVYNLLLDKLKIVGGSAEMTWRGAPSRYVANHKGEGQPVDKDNLKTNVENMIDGLDPVAYLQNVELDHVQGEVVDPSGIFDTILKLISGAVGQPQRMLTGSERGELASTQDRATFYGRMQERREQFCEPMVLRPLIDRLISMGILPTPTKDGEKGEYAIEWDTLFELNEVEQTQVIHKKAQAVKAVASMGDPAEIGTTAERREAVLGWSPEIGGESSIDEDVPEPGDAPEETQEPGAEPPEGTEPMDEDEAQAIVDEIMGRTESGQQAVADGGEVDG